MQDHWGFWISAAVQSALTLFVFVLPGLYLWSWVDSKIGADMQARVGPSRAGAAGWLQPVADFLRLIQKFRPGSKADHGPWAWWLQGVPLFALLAITPVVSGAPLLDAPMSALMSVFFALSFAWIGLLLSWRDGSAEARFGSIRQVALATAGFLPALIAFLHAGFSAGGMSWSRFDSIQGWAPWSWLAFSGPFSLVSALVFLASGLLIFSARPFQSGSEPMAWVVASYPGEAGIRLIWVRWSQRLAVFCWFLIAVRIFFGGSALPSLFDEILAPGAPTGMVFAATVVASKTFCLLFLVSLLSRTLPAVRADQAYDFSWRVLSPISMLALALGRLIDGGQG